ILIFLNLIGFTVMCGALANFALNRVDVAAWLDELPVFERNKNLRFAVGTESDAIGFEVTVPETWYLADSGSPSWQTQQERLENEFPAVNWQAFETDLGSVVPEGEAGQLSSEVVILETDSERITSSPTMFPTLRLQAVQPLPSEYRTADCDTLQQMLDDLLATESRRQSTVEGSLVGDCLYYLHYRGTDQTTQLAIRRFDITLPLPDNRLAQWRLTIPDALYPRYEASINTLLESLHIIEN